MEPTLFQKTFESFQSYNFINHHAVPLLISWFKLLSVNLKNVNGYQKGFCYKVAEESHTTLPKMKKVDQWSIEHIDTKYNGKKDSDKK